MIMKLRVLTSLLLSSSVATGAHQQHIRSDDPSLIQRMMHGGGTDDDEVKNRDGNFPVDISSYSLRFEKCQAVKTPSSDTSKSLIERYAVFRLCPEHECSTCAMNYGEYLVDLADYLTILSQYFHETQGAMCTVCEQCMKKDPAVKENAEAKLEDFGVSCKNCQAECRTLNEMESNGYIDATNFLRCTMVYEDPNNEEKRYYAGPVCSEGGNAVTIGVFKDDYCEKLDSSKNIRQFLGTDNGSRMNLAYSFLKMTYLETCLSCEEDNVEGFHDLKADNEDQDSVKQFCEKIYDHSHKCEADHGFMNRLHDRVGVDEKQTCQMIEHITSGRQSNNDSTEEIVEPEFEEEAVAESILDQQSLILVVIGVLLSLIAVGIKVSCCASRGNRELANEEGYHDDIIHIKVKTEDEEVDVTESSNSSCDEHHELVEQTAH